MMHSVGKSFASSASPQDIFIVPNGYVAHVSLVYITNTSGNTGTYNISWRHAHGNPPVYDHVIRFGYGKSLSSGASDQFSQGILVMKSLDKMTITAGMAVDVIVSFDLLQAPPLYAFAGE